MFQVNTSDGSVGDHARTASDNPSQQIQCNLSFKANKVGSWCPPSIGSLVANIELLLLLPCTIAELICRFICILLASKA